MPEPITHPRDSKGRRRLAIASTDYEAFRADLDTANGFPAGVGTRAVTLTTIPPLAETEEDDGKIYMVVQAHDDRLIKEEVFSAHSAKIEQAEEWDAEKVGGYTKGDLVIYEDETYRNFVPGNTYAPDVSGWRNTQRMKTWSASNAPYTEGSKVFWKGKKWQSLASDNSEEPGPMASQWEDTTEWVPGEDYNVNEEREFGGGKFRSQENQTGEAGAEPPSKPDKWAKV